MIPKGIDTVSLVSILFRTTRSKYFEKSTSLGNTARRKHVIGFMLKLERE